MAVQANSTENALRMDEINHTMKLYFSGCTVVSLILIFFAVRKTVKLFKMQRELPLHMHLRASAKLKYVTFGKRMRNERLMYENKKNIPGLNPTVPHGHGTPPASDIVPASKDSGISEPTPNITSVYTDNHLNREMLTIENEYSNLDAMKNVRGSPGVQRALNNVRKNATTEAAPIVTGRFLKNTQSQNRLGEKWPSTSSDKALVDYKVAEEVHTVVGDHFGAEEHKKEPESPSTADNFAPIAREQTFLCESDGFLKNSDINSGAKEDEKSYEETDSVMTNNDTLSGCTDSSELDESDTSEAHKDILDHAVKERKSMSESSESSEASDAAEEDESSQEELEIAADRHRDDPANIEIETSDSESFAESDNDSQRTGSREPSVSCRKYGTDRIPEIYKISETGAVHSIDKSRGLGNRTRTINYNANREAFVLEDSNANREAFVLEESNANREAFVFEESTPSSATSTSKRVTFNPATVYINRDILTSSNSEIETVSGLDDNFNTSQRHVYERIWESDDTFDQKFNELENSNGNCHREVDDTGFSEEPDTGETARSNKRVRPLETLVLENAAINQMPKMSQENIYETISDRK